MIILICVPVSIIAGLGLLISFATFYWFWIWRFVRINAEGSVREIRHTEAGWFIKSLGRESNWLEVRLLEDSVVTENYVYLRFVVPEQTSYRNRRVLPVLIAYDSVSATQFRRLKVFLRFIY